jgi:signal transduction histidine kinase
VLGVFESPLSSKPGGMGIGLGISRAIVAAHGGRLWAEPGPGGRFYFSLPIGVQAHE